MPKQHILFGWLLLALVALPAQAVAPPLGLSLPAKIVDVVDGDTLTVDLTFRVRVRLLDCWAPEIRGGTLESRDAAAASEKHLREMALGQPAIIFVPLTGVRNVGQLFSFDRVLARVFVYDEDLSIAQVVAGHASSTKQGKLGE